MACKCGLSFGFVLNLFVFSSSHSGNLRPFVRKPLKKLTVSVSHTVDITIMKTCLILGSSSL